MSKICEVALVKCYAYYSNPFSYFRAVYRRLASCLVLRKREIFKLLLNCLNSPWIYFMINFFHDHRCRRSINTEEKKPTRSNHHHKDTARIHKWRPRNYSFASVLIILTSLTSKQRFFWILFVLTRLVRMISIKHKNNCLAPIYVHDLSRIWRLIPNEWQSVIRFDDGLRLETLACMVICDHSLRFRN